MTGGGKRHAGEVLERQAWCDERAGEVSCKEKRIKRSVKRSVSEGDISLGSMLSLLNVSRMNDGRRKAACR